MWTLLLLLACRPEGAPGAIGPAVVGDMALDAPDPDLPLARTLRFRTNVAAEVVVTLWDGDHEVQLRGPRGEDHTIALLGLRADRAYTSELRLVGADTESTAPGPDVTTAPLPEDFPRLDVLAWEPEDVEPGYTLINLSVPRQDGSTVTFLTIFDAALEPVWMVHTPSSSGYSRWSPDGLWVLNGGTAVHFTPEGAIDRRLVSLPVEPAMPDVDVPVDLDVGLQYDLLPASDDSFWTVTYGSFTVDAFPASYDDLTPVPGPHTLRDMVFSEVALDGSVRRRWPLSERLDTQRIGFDSLDASPEGRDWAHTNAVNHDPEGGLLVSSRHQDAVASLDAEGDLRWILSNPEGWAEPFEAKRLQPVGEVTWPYHQHAPHMGEDGVLVMFDNGNQRHSPYDVPDTVPEAFTRVVGYRVDSAAMTVEQAFSYQDTVTGPLYCEALGDADPQPMTGNVLATYGTVREEGGVANEVQGRGRVTVRLVEFRPESLETVLDLRFSTLGSTHPGGVRAFRADRIPADAVPWWTPIP